MADTVALDILCWRAKCWSSRQRVWCCIPPRGIGSGLSFMRRLIICKYCNYSCSNTTIDSLSPHKQQQAWRFRTMRPGIVHRLDKGTTGVLVVATSFAASAALSDQFRIRISRKSWLSATVRNPGTGRHSDFRRRSSYK
jgi:RNA pseudouridylate synthase